MVIFRDIRLPVRLFNAFLFDDKASQEEKAWSPPEDWTTDGRGLIEIDPTMAPFEGHLQYQVMHNDNIMTTIQLLKKHHSRTGAISCILFSCIHFCELGAGSLPWLYLST